MQIILEPFFMYINGHFRSTMPNQLPKRAQLKPKGPSTAQPTPGNTPNTLNVGGHAPGAKEKWSGYTAKQLNQPETVVPQDDEAW